MTAELALLNMCGIVCLANILQVWFVIEVKWSEVKWKTLFLGLFRASYKRGWGVELGSTEKKLPLSGLSGTWTRDLQF